MKGLEKYLKLETLLGKDERIARYFFTGSYCEYECIIPDVPDEDILRGRIDISGCLEDTLHRILEAGTADDARRIMGAHIPAEEELAELDRYGEYLDIDLGYVIPGLLERFR